MSKTLEPERYDAITFDCYGTLINWSQGIADFLRPRLESQDVHTIDSFVLEVFSELEPIAQAGEYKTYRQVLREVLIRFGKRLGFAVGEDDLIAFPASIADWPAFPDSLPALKQLGARFELVIVSNVDDDLFDLTLGQLPVNFDHVVTAQQVGAYKPDPAPFNVALERIGIDKSRILHTAQSRFHDIVPARALGLDTVWIRRDADATSAAKEVDAEPDWTFDDMESFAAAMLPG
jgi:2-haloacid dehalogenase